MDGENPSSSFSFSVMGKPIGCEWANDPDGAQLQVWTMLYNFEPRKSVQRFQRLNFSPIDMAIGDELVDNWNYTITGL